MQAGAAELASYAGKPPSLFELPEVPQSCGTQATARPQSGKGRAIAKRRRIPLLFGEESLKTVCFDSSILKRALKETRSVSLRAS
jgi:hypothetical protein